MQYIENLFIMAQHNQLLVFIIGILATFLESFVPALPLTGIVLMNAALLGFFKGLLASVIGSFTGTLILFILANKFRNIKYFDNIKNDKTKKVIDWIKKQNYVALYLCYSSPFVPSCLVSIASGFSNMKSTNFLPGMLLGKITMFSIASYIGYDFQKIISSPEKIVGIILIILLSFLIGKTITNKIENNKATIYKKLVVLTSFFIYKLNLYTIFSDSIQ